MEVDALGDSLSTTVRHGIRHWELSADEGNGPDPVSAFLGALGSCLLMSLRVAARARKFELGRCRARLRATERGHVREIDIELEVATAEDDARLAQLVEVAERGCHIRALIRSEVAVRLNVVRT